MEHDCVIVPNLGGFLASDVPAQFSPSRQVLLPPRRKIAFNIYLKQNDGLLASQLVEYEKISYPEALKRIEQYVKSCFDRLGEGKKVLVERVGTLYYDQEKHLLFEPFRNSQLRMDCFGLSSVQILEEEKDEAASRRIENARRQVLREKPIRESVKNPASGSRKKKIIGMVLIAGAITWFAVNLYLVAPERADISSMSLFKPDSQVLTQIPEASVPVQKTETVFVASVEPVKQKDVVESPLSVQTKTETNAPILSERNSISEVKNSFYLVAGVFRISENADQKLQELKNKGYNEAMMIPTGELHYVCFNGFSSRNEALAMHDSLRKSGEDGWIWRH